MASIRLTKIMRESIVKQIMADVPCVQYRDQARKLINEDITSQLPQDVKDFLKTPHADRLEATRFTAYFHEASIQIYIRGANPLTDKISAETQAKIEELSKLDKAQSDSRRALKRKVEITLAQFTTVEAVRKALPEFEQYLPTAPEPVKNLPAVTNTVVDLMQAGWPKQEQK